MILSRLFIKVLVLARGWRAEQTGYMAEYMKYGFERDKRGNFRLRLDVSEANWQRAEQTKRFNRLTRKLAENEYRPLNIQEQKTGKRILVNDKRLHPEVLPDRTAVVANIIKLFKVFEVIELEDRADPALKTDLALMPDIETGRLRSRFELAYPTASDQAASGFATAVLREMAANIGYDSLSEVSAVIDRQTDGIMLGLGNGSVYYPQSATGPSYSSVCIEASLANHEQQLLGLAGAVALAHAAELVNQ